MSNIQSPGTFQRALGIVQKLHSDGIAPTMRNYDAARPSDLPSAIVLMTVSSVTWSEIKAAAWTGYDFPCDCGNPITTYRLATITLPNADDSRDSVDRSCLLTLCADCAKLHDETESYICDRFRRVS